MRQIILDTETTGLEPSEGHRIIEIGCVELINRRASSNRYQQYINPGREIDAGAMEVHGITNEMVAEKPKFADIAQSLLDFIEGAELIIHNAPFDMGFLNNELSLTANGGKPVRIEEICSVVDTLKLARSMHPGQKNDLDSLCRRYNVDNSHRTLHGALLDAEILADVYLAMTGGQTGLFEETHSHLRNATATNVVAPSDIRRLDPNRPKLPVLAASAEELAAHQAWLEELDKKSGGKCLWKMLETVST
ncbi:MAG: DNA polymerase III subunit epsilon [Candidatus Muproteobacteria bacterium RIFCSPHIGHO2_12_FULL_60_33]|uniref:DNA polymerase III subunit epsilon n=1 Tax=Candidatus Muproteobacteria bacterium RIFCSPLOWO2_01_FULL_60_18 TaxID=1817768 RepID=A0A1F6U178_9PROT|nr:MAG: DNA polymerase III subunit epsilon [Candidatus Muproteobacteria bacterium RIFCSPLOWO2_01_FULL_60_18]OGI53619.1 MAG: DNA polymerase III subunit epsilon [Candidatus Muproteobacteria bacterium RIFCSPHIGHO2_01_60_12]OGI56362.1 MAG: DNA polymerase III subunit epsilon [Candidatus Muproteobacteria bacterium RIFCSPHIGHO2_12_FULL_60_33]OGI56774.1 MAG: DNA polymerase III subunit epsilon [Candidatus Muproteobacteria bacterium RIFCSPHIGHO2_02_FULL_60_13]